MLSNPDAPPHPSLPDEKDRDGADTERRKTEREKPETDIGRKKRGARHRKHLERQEER